VAIATRDRILQRCSSDALTRYSTTSSSMMLGRITPDGGATADAFGRIGTTVEADGTGVVRRGGVGCGEAMTAHPARFVPAAARWSVG